MLVSDFEDIYYANLIDAFKFFKTLRNVGMSRKINNSPPLDPVFANLPYMIHISLPLP